MIEEAQVVLHEADQPDFIADFLDADVLTRQRGSEIDFAVADAYAASVGDGNCAVVERIAQITEAAIAAR